MKFTIVQLRDLVCDMAGLSGSKYIHQSHKCTLKHCSIESFLQMAEQYDPLSKSPKSYSYNPLDIVDMYKKGLMMMQENFKSNNIIKRN
jgi:hypothetical protein